MGRKRKVRPGDIISPGARKRQLDRLYVKYESICQICFKFCPRNQASRDHVLELCLGGDSSEENLVLAHQKCNEDKSKEISRRLNAEARSLLSKSAEELPAEWWDKMLTKQIWGTIYRLREGGPVAGSLPSRLKYDESFSSPIM